MSQAFELVCHATKQKVWIGQGWGEMTNLYAYPVAMENLRLFFIATKGHPLFFLCTDIDGGEWHDYDEFNDEGDG